MVKSKMTNYEGDKTPDEAVACMIKVLDKYEQDPQSLNGKFIHRVIFLFFFSFFFFYFDYKIFINKN